MVTGEKDRLNSQSALVCLSHLRWDFVYQRPQHLLSRAAEDREVIFFEEPQYCDIRGAAVEITQPRNGLVRVVPLLPHGISLALARKQQSRFLKEILNREGISRYDLWYYTPMGLHITGELLPEVVIFDCMDELSGFLGAPPELRELEQRLLDVADVVFTGGASLYEAKRLRHGNVHCCPSSIEGEHFSQAMNVKEEPADQKQIAPKRVGFYGVIDERLDVELLANVARLRPDVQFVLIGPVVKIDEQALPKADNIHYLGMRQYEELPAYLAGWDVAMLPFAHNAATRFISPTKTPEYLAAGRPVVSTSIRDVVRPYGELGLISIADTPEEFSAAIDREAQRRHDPAWRKRIADLLATTSWDSTWNYMSSVIESVRAEGDSGIVVPFSRTLSTSETGVDAPS